MRACSAVLSHGKVSSMTAICMRELQAITMSNANSFSSRNAASHSRRLRASATARCAAVLTSCSPPTLASDWCNARDSSTRWYFAAMNASNQRLPTRTYFAPRIYVAQWDNKTLGFPLMISFRKAMRNIFAHHLPQGAVVGG